VRLLAATAAPDEQLEIAFAHRTVDLPAIAGDDLGVDPGLRQRALDRGGAVEELLGRDHPDRGVEPVGITGFGEQRLGLFDIKRIARVGQQAEGAGIDRALLLDAEEGHDRAVDAVIVDQVPQRLAHLGVGVFLVLHRRGEVVEPGRGHGLDGDVLVGLKRLQVRRGEREAHVDVALLEPQPLRLAFGEVAHQYARHRGGVFPELLVAGQDDVFVGLPAGQLEGAGAGGIVGEPGLTPVAVLLVLLDHLAVEDRAAPGLGEIHHDQLGVVLLRQGEDEGLVVLGDEVGVDVLGDEAARFQRRGLREVQRQQPLEAVFHVMRGDRIARGEDGVVAQGEGDGHVVVGDLPALREPRLEHAGLGVELDQCVVDVVQDLDGLASRDGRRVHGQDVVHVERHDQLILGRFGQHGAGPGHQHRHRGACKQMSHVSSLRFRDIPVRAASGHAVVLDVVEIDVLAQTGTVGQVDIAVRIHRIGQRFQVVEPVVVFEERVQQAALVPAAIAHRGHHLQVHGGVAVDLAVHAKGFGHVQGLERGGDAAHVVDAGAQDVAGPGLDPFGALPVLAGGAFGPEHWNVELVGEPLVGRHRLLIHRLFDPVEAELFQPAAQLECVGARIPVEGVDHQADIRPHRLAHRGAGLEVHLHIWRPAHRRHPGVQLDALVAARHELFGKAAVILRRGQPALDLVATHGRTVGQHLVAIAADQLVDRLAQRATGQIPKRAIDHRQRAVGQLRRRAALPVGQILPQPLAVAVILTDEHLADVFVEHMRAHHLRRGKAVALVAVLGADRQDALIHLVFGARMGMAGAVGMASRLVPEHPRGDVGDDHVLVLPCRKRRGGCGPSILYDKLYYRLFGAVNTGFRMHRANSTGHGAGRRAALSGSFQICVTERRAVPRVQDRFSRHGGPDRRAASRPHPCRGDRRRAAGGHRQGRFRAG